MATLKGAYNRVVSALFKYWKKEDTQEKEKQGEENRTPQTSQVEIKIDESEDLFFDTIDYNKDIKETASKSPRSVLKFKPGKPAKPKDVLFTLGPPSPPSPSTTESKKRKLIRSSNNFVKRFDSLRNRTTTSPDLFRGRVSTLNLPKIPTLTLRKRSKTEIKDLSKMENLATEISLGNGQVTETAYFLSRLKEFNAYEDSNYNKLKLKQDKHGGLVVDGMLNIYWGLKSAIRLQMADTNVKIRPRSQIVPRVDPVLNDSAVATSLGKNQPKIPKTCSHLEGDCPICNSANVRRRENTTTLRDRKYLSVVEETGNLAIDPIINIENGILGETKPRRKDKRRGVIITVSDNSPQPESPAKVIMRKGRRTSARYNKNRGSINGHLYDYKTSVFTPAYGSMTTVRVTSIMKSSDVIKHLLSKFRVQNDASEFSLFLIKETGESRQIQNEEYPMTTRILAGPNEQFSKIFIMEKNSIKISHDVAQYIKLDFRLLENFVEKFNEEEEREIKLMRDRYELYREMLRKRINVLMSS